MLETSPAASGDDATLWAALSEMVAVFPGVERWRWRWGTLKGLAAKCEEGKSRRTGLEPREMVVLALLGGHMVLVWRDEQGRQEQKSEKPAGVQVKQSWGFGGGDARDFGILRVAGGLGRKGH